jgi:predicted nucleic-acid-binding protein
MIFLDANYLIALFVDDHKFYKRANEIHKEIKDQELIISNSIILEVMTVLNITLKVSKEKLEEAYNTLNSGRYGIVEDLTFYDDTMKRMINYLPDRLPFFDCLYIEIMEQIEIKQILTFDKHFNNKEIEIIR